MTKIKGEFSIIKGFGNENVSEQFSVTNPHKPKDMSHIVYTITGVD